MRAHRDPPPAERAPVFNSKEVSSKIQYRVIVDAIDAKRRVGGARRRLQQNEDIACNSAQIQMKVGDLDPLQVPVCDRWIEF